MSSRAHVVTAVATACLVLLSFARHAHAEAAVSSRRETQTKTLAELHLKSKEQNLHGVGASCTPGTQEYDCPRELVCMDNICVGCIHSQQCTGYPMYICSKSGKCKHKPLFPSLSGLDILCSLISIVFCALAAGGGIGGGGLLVPIFMVVSKFSPNQAVPLSKGTIFGGAIANLLMNIYKKHPTDSYRKLIDYDVAMMLLPMQLAGTLIGVLWNRIFPDWLIVTLLLAVMILTTYRTSVKSAQLYNQESMDRDKMALRMGGGDDAEEAEGLLRGLDGGGGDSDDLHDEEAGDDKVNKRRSGSGLGGNNGEEKKDSAGAASAAGVDSKEKKDKDGGAVADISPALHLGTASASQLAANQKAAALRQNPEAFQAARNEIRDYYSRTNWQTIWILIACNVYIVICCLLIGGHGAPSLVGIECGSLTYWLIWCSVFPVIYMVVLVMGGQIRSSYEWKIALNYPFQKGDIHWTTQAVYLYPLYCMVAGIAAGCIGVGGGMIAAPLMLELGMIPEVTSATAAFMVLFTSASTSSQFIVHGMMLYDYALWYAIIGFLSTIVGQVVIFILVKRYGRPSLLVISIALVLGIATIMMAVQGITNIYDQIDHHVYMGFKPCCEH